MRQLLFFGASWCGPCRAVKQAYLNDVLESCPEQVIIIDLEDQPRYAHDLRITRIPTIVFIDDEKTQSFCDNYPKIENAIAWLKGETDDFD